MQYESFIESKMSTTWVPALGPGDAFILRGTDALGAEASSELVTIQVIGSLPFTSLICHMLN